MAMQVNNSTVDAQGYVTTEAAQDPAENPQATAAAAAAASSRTQAQQLANPAVQVGNLPTSTFQGVNASSVAHNAGSTLGQNSDPELPYANVAKGEAPSGQHLVSVTSSLHLSDTEAYRILQEAGQKTFELDSTLSRSANMGVLNAKNAQIKDLKDQIQGERTSAITQLSFAVLSTVAGGAMGVSGTLLRRSTGETNQALLTEQKLKSSLGDPVKTKEHHDEFVKHYLKAKGLELEKSPSNNLTPASGLQSSQSGTASVSTLSSPSKPGIPSAAAAKKAEAEKQNGAVKKSNEPVTVSDDRSIESFHAARARYAAEDGAAAPSLSTKSLMIHSERFFAERSSTRSPAEKLQEKIYHSPNGKEALGAGLDSSAQALSSTVNNLGTAIDTLAGGKYESDQAKIAQKQDDVQISIAQQVADSSKASKDRAQKQTSDSLDTLKEVAARYAAVIDKL